MKRIKLIYNPISGDGGFKNELDLVIKNFQENGYLVEMLRTDKNGMECDFFNQSISSWENTIIVVAGGDGTVSQVVNIMIKNQIQSPLGVIPMGTANDLGSYLGMSRNIEECCKTIIENNQIKMDIGMINDNYFISVASGGLVATVPQATDVRLKNTLGKLAYYLKGLEEIPTFRPISISLESPDYQYEGELLFFLILNGQFAGGFKKIAPRASIIDGKFDVILFKNSNLPVLARLFVKLLRGEHINDPNVIFFQTNELVIKPYCNKNSIMIDVDGEAGPILPLFIKNKSKSISMIVSEDRKDKI
jgi:YegS/Rv2252/BmrU family lipid kinase